MIIGLRESGITPVFIRILFLLTPRPVKTTAPCLRLRPVSSGLDKPLELSHRHRVLTDSEDSNLHFMLAFINSSFRLILGRTH